MKRFFSLVLCLFVVALVTGCATTAPQTRVVYVEKPVPVVVAQTPVSAPTQVVMARQASPVPTKVVVVEQRPQVSWWQMLPRVDLRIDSRRSESCRNSTSRSSHSSSSRRSGSYSNSHSNSRSSRSDNRSRNDNRVRLDIDDIFSGLAGRRR